MTRPHLITRWGWNCLATLLLSLATIGAPAASPKRVLILDPFERNVGPFGAVVSTFRSTLAGELGEPVEFYEVPLDLARFADPEGADPLLAFLEDRIKCRPIDLVVPIGASAARFAALHRERLFPDKSVLLVAPDPRLIPMGGLLRPNATLVTQRIDLRGMVEDILRIQPQTTNIAVVFGATALERIWIESCHREFQSFTNRVGFMWLNDLSLEQLLKRCASLPPRSFILHGMFMMDAHGLPCEHNEALRGLHQSANAPLFGYFASEFGLGPIGGRLYRESEVGAQAARTAIRILRGESAGSILPQELHATTPVYDWRELKRWGVPESRLPTGSVIQFRELSVWERYRWLIAGTVSFCLLQAALIIGLLINRIKRRQGEAEATLLAELSSKFVNLPTNEVDGEIDAAQRRIGEFLGMEMSWLWQWSAEAPESFAMTHFYRAQEVPKPQARLNQEGFPWVRQQLLADRIVAFSSLEDLPDEAARDREAFRQLGVKSNLTIPLSVGGEPTIGALSLNTTRSKRNWPDAQIKRLQLVAQIFTNALARKRADQALHESQERMSMASEAAKFGVWVWHIARDEVWGSERWLRLFGFTTSAAVSFEMVLQRIHPDDREMVEREVRHAVVNQNDYEGRFRAVLPDGKERWIASRGRGYQAANGTPARMVGAAIDITETRRLSHQLESAAKEWQATFDSIEDLVMILDIDHHIIRVNAATVRFLGLPMERIVGSLCCTVMHGTSCPIQGCPCQKSFQAGRNAQLELLHETSGKWLLLSTDPIRDAAGNVIGAVHVTRDISKRKRAEEALRASEELSRATFEQAAVGIAHVGTDGRWLRVNDKLCEILGKPREQLLQLTFQDLSHPEDLEANLDLVGHVLSSESNSYSMEKRYFRHDRSFVWVMVTVSLVRTPAGVPLHFIFVVEDITGRKGAEEELRDLSGRLINAQEQERTRLARELHDGLSQNLALQAVELELMGQRPPATAVEVTRRMQELSAQTKSLSTEVHRISHDLHPAKLTQLGLSAAINELCHTVSSVHQIPVSFDHNRIPHGLPLNLALCLYRVAQEALQNVVKHSHARHARVELNLVGTEIQLRVADDGSGFEVGSNQATSALGLVSMRERVRLVHGQISIKSRPGEGTRVTLSIPVPEGTKL